MINKEQLYADYHDKIFGYLYHAVNNTAIAEDLCSEVLVKVFRKLDSFDESKSKLSTWIYNVTRNTLYDYFRTRHKCYELYEDIPCDDVDEILDYEAELEILARALASLKDLEREIIVEKYYRHNTLQDIAVDLGLSYFLVRSIHKTGLKKIRNFFEKE